MPRLISHNKKHCPTYIPVIVLAAVFLLIAIRQVGGFHFKIWQIMLGGALAVLITGQVTLHDALGAINLDVMLFLSGMFIVGEALWRAATSHPFPAASFLMPGLLAR